MNWVSLSRTFFWTCRLPIGYSRYGPNPGVYLILIQANIFTSSTFRGTKPSDTDILQDGAPLDGVVKASERLDGPPQTIGATYSFSILEEPRQLQGEGTCFCFVFTRSDLVIAVPISPSLYAHAHAETSKHMLHPAKCIGAWAVLLLVVLVALVRWLPRVKVIFAVLWSATV